MVARNLLPVSAQVLLTADNAASTVLKVPSTGHKAITEMLCLLRHSGLMESTVCGVRISYCSCSGTEHQPQVT